MMTTRRRAKALHSAWTIVATLQRRARQEPQGIVNHQTPARALRSFAPAAFLTKTNEVKP